MTDRVHRSERQGRIEEVDVAESPIAPSPPPRIFTGPLSAAVNSSRLPLLLGLGMAGGYAAFATLAALQFPQPYGPWHNNTVSQLGNATLNPRGAILYLIGCAVAGTFAIAFFVSLNPWKHEGTRIQSRVFLAVQMLGIIGSAALFLNALFPETQYASHHFLAGLVFNAFAAAMVLSPVALWTEGRFNVPIAVYCLLAFGAVIVMFVFAGNHWVEWVPATMILLFPPFLGLVLRLRSNGLRLV